VQFDVKDDVMLVIVSDLHLTDGTSSSTIHPGAFVNFTERLREMAQRASWRADGSYHSIDCIDLVLLGDVFDITRSHHWLSSEVRPWSDPHSQGLFETTSKIVDDILSLNSESLRILRSLAAEGDVSVTPATQHGEPAYGAACRSVPVRTHYMVGNSDWQLHLSGANWDRLREKVSHHLGLANHNNSPFPHDPYESDELLEVFRRHRVLARHGDIFDPLNFAGDRDGSSLGEAIAIELIQRFVMEVEQELGEDLSPLAIAGLHQLDNVRPLALTPLWIEGMLEKHCPQPNLRKQIKNCWDSHADAMLSLPFVRERAAALPNDMIDGLERSLKFSKRFSNGWSQKTNQWLQSLRGASSDSYYEHALNEQDFRNRRARHIVYGHTHLAENVPLDASHADGFVMNQLYFNSGAWRRIHRQIASAPAGQEFIPTDTMTFLTFFQGDERGGRPFEVWSGTLGASAVVPSATARPQQAPVESHGQISVSASNPPINAPHFSPAHRSVGRSRAGFTDRAER